MRVQNFVNRVPRSLPCPEYLWTLPQSPWKPSQVWKAVNLFQISVVFCVLIRPLFRFTVAYVIKAFVLNSASLVNEPLSSRHKQLENKPHLGRDYTRSNKLPTIALKSTQCSRRFHGKTTFFSKYSSFDARAKTSCFVSLYLFRC